MSSTEAEARCRRLAQKQFGCFSVDQAIQAGFSKAALYRRVQSGKLLRILPRVFRESTVTESFEGVALAALLWGGQESAISHQAAGKLWGFDACEVDQIHLTLPAARRTPAPWITVHTGTLRHSERVRLGRFTVTSASRTLFDVAAAAPITQLELVLESALRKRAVSIDRLNRFLENQQTSGYRGIANLRSLLLERENDFCSTDSALEVKVQRVLRVAGIDGFEVRPLLKLADGSLVEPDLFFRTQQVTVEAHGYRYHSGRVAWERDIKRRSRLEANGIKVLEVTDRILRENPESFLQHLRMALGVHCLPGMSAK